MYLDTPVDADRYVFITDASFVERGFCAEKKYPGGVNIGGGAYDRRGRYDFPAEYDTLSLANKPSRGVSDVHVRFTTVLCRLLNVLSPVYWFRRAERLNSATVPRQTAPRPRQTARNSVRKQTIF